MTSSHKQSSFLLKSSIGDTFSMAFIVYQEGNGSYLLTTAHVVEASDLDTLEIEGKKVTVVQMSRCDNTDIALLYVEGLEGIALNLSSANLQEEVFFEIDRFEDIHSKYKFEKLRGRITKYNNLEKYELSTKDKSYSGAAILCPSSGDVLAIATKENSTGNMMATPIESISSIWNDMPDGLLSGKVCKDRVKRVETLDNIGIVAMLMAVVILFSYNGFTLKDNSYLTQISSVTNNNIITMGLTDKFMINIIRPYQDSIDELNSKLKNSITLDDRLHLFTLIHKANEEKVKKIREISRLKELFDNSKSQIVKDAKVILEKNGIGKTIVHLEDQENNNIEKLHRVKMRDNAERNRLKAQLFIIEDRYNEAKESYQKALEYERTHITLFDYALFLQKHNYFDESIATYEQLLIEQRALAKSKPLVYNSRVATTLNNLATIYKARNEIKRVEKTYLEALMLYRASDKTDLLLYYSKIAVTLNNLSAHYYSNNEIEKAEDTYLEALTLKQMLANSDS